MASWHICWVGMGGPCLVASEDNKRADSKGQRCVLVTGHEQSARQTCHARKDCLDIISPPFFFVGRQTGFEIWRERDVFASGPFSPAQEAVAEIGRT